VIVETIKRYYPEWEPPFNNGNTWLKTLCPFHGESVASAAVSFDLDAFNCFGCDVKGDAVSIIRHEEGVGFAEAFRIAESLSVGSDIPLQRKPPRKRSRRVFGEPGDTGRDTVRPGIRSRTAPWT
jgi:DNA primase